jgi:hypothetical protein
MSPVCLQRVLSGWVAVCSLALCNTASLLAALVVPGDLYSSNYFSRVIEQYLPSGTYLSSFTVPSQYGSEVRGLVVGPDQLLYATTVTPSGLGVIALDNSGTVTQTYSGSEYVAGNLSYGKIAFAKNGQFFVTGQDHLVRFTPGSPTGSVIYSNNQVFDVEPLPSGNLLVLSAYDLDEITTDGALVRSIQPSISLVDARGVEYDAVSNSIYVTMLGFSGQFFQLMKLDGSTGHVQKQFTFNYGDDLFLTSDSRLLVGSRTQAPGIFDLNLNQLGTMTGGQQMFVTQAIPEPASMLLFASWVLVIDVARMRRA